MRTRLTSIFESILLAATLLGAALSLCIAAAGGLRFSLFGIDVRATDPYRPLVVAAIAFTIRMLVGSRGSLRADATRLRRALTPRTVALALMSIVVVVGVMKGSGVAGGADSYGYISQADLWLQGDGLVIAQPDAARVPWPDAQWSLAPLGYRASPSREGIVPMYSAGFPLLLALFKFAAGQCAIGWAVPVFAGILILVTFAIGKQTVSDDVGVAAAWLMATSPVFLYMLMSPMSDIPAAAFWGLAAYACLTGSRAGALLGGVAAAIAVLIRPNLVHVGMLMALWMAATDLRSTTGARRLARAALFVVPVALSSVAVAFLNQHLYGAVTNSGYGSLGVLFAPGYVVRNVLNYSRWLVETQTPLAAIGLLAVLLPASRWLKPGAEIRGRGLLAVMAAAVIVTYLFYFNFDAWWYLRFLLPMWVVVCIGTAFLVTGRSGRSFGAAGKVVLVALGVYGMWYAQKEGTLDLGRNEQRYVNIAQLVRDTTEPNSVIITLQHSGSVRYYGGRTTLRYEVLSDRWLDRAIAWLDANGFKPYILLDAPEHEPFRQKFGGRNVAGNLDMAIVLEYRDRYNTSTFLYDPMQPSTLSSMPILVAAAQDDVMRDCVPPAAAHPIFAMENATR